jgi:hypothetical protein
MAVELYVLDGGVVDTNAWWISPSIVVRKAQVANLAAGPGASENPTAGATNYVYVCVGRNGTEVPATATLKVCCARGGPQFVWDQLSEVVPDQTCSNLTGNAVQHIADTNIKMALPGSGAQKWFECSWSVPAGLGNIHPCILAFIDDGTGGPGDVPNDNRFAQRNLAGVDQAKTNQRYTFNVMMGNQKSLDLRIGLLVALEGAAAEGAKVEVHFPDPAVLDRIAAPLRPLPEVLLPPKALFAPIKRRPLPVNVGFVQLRDAASMWGMKKLDGHLELTRTLGGCSWPTTAGELHEVTLAITPTKPGHLTAHVVQYRGNGHIPGGFTFDLEVVG